MNTQPTIHSELLSEVFKALSHPIRIEFFLFLSQTPTCVCEIAKQFKIDKSIASKHLTQMRNAGLITMKKQGTRVIYNIAADCAIAMINCLNKNIIDGKLNKLELKINN